MIGRVAAIAVIIGLVACASNKKVELIYEEPVTSVWTDRAPPPSPAQAVPPPTDASAPAQTSPPAQPPAGDNPPPMPQAGSAPVYPQTFPQTYPPPQPASPPPNQQPPSGWRNTQPPPQPPPTGFPDPSVTTVVVPDQNPTTQTTLKRRTGWVRGGYD